MIGVKRAQHVISNGLLEATFGTTNVSTCWVRISGMILGDEIVPNMLCFQLFLVVVAVVPWKPSALQHSGSADMSSRSFG